MRFIIIPSLFFFLTVNMSCVSQPVATNSSPVEASANAVVTPPAAELQQGSITPVTAALQQPVNSGARHPTITTPAPMASLVPAPSAAKPKEPLITRADPGQPEEPKAVAARFLALLEQYNAGASGAPGKKFWIMRKVVSKDLLAAFGRESLGMGADPFINAQDDRQGFILQKMVFQDEIAKLTIGFKGAANEAPIVYVLVKEGNEWKLDDIQYKYPDGSVRTLRELY